MRSRKRNEGDEEESKRLKREEKWMVEMIRKINSRWIYK